MNTPCCLLQSPAAPRPTSVRARACWLRTGLGLAAAVLAVAVRAQPADTLPTGGQIVSGAGAISQSGNQMTVNQGTDRMIAQWNTFNIGRDASVQFNQPGASSVALNRIQDQNPSQILGSLSANGQVFLINPGGVYFGKNATVDVGGLVASSLDISDADFIAGSYRFASGGAAGGVFNHGKITAGAGGIVALISPVVSNDGTITAQAGGVVLAAGNKVTLDFGGDGMISLTVDEAAVNAQASNSGLIKSDGGVVVMTARAAGELIGKVVNNSGVIEATTLSNINGRIILDGGEVGIVENTGTLSATGASAGETGGSIVMTGEKVGVSGEALVDVSGGAGGGNIFVGGGFHGTDASVANAKRTYVGSDATLRADGGQTGNAGEIVVWSDEVTRFHGDLSARGGAISGDGGTVEISSKGFLGLSGRIDAGASHGNAGTLLLDPRNITVQTGGVALLGDVDQFGVNPSDDLTIAPLTITAATDGGTAVTLQANSDIVVNNSIISNNPAGNGGALTFRAGRSITLNASIDSDDGDVSFTINDASATADRQADPGNFTNNSLVDAGIGAVTLTVGTNAGGSGDIAAGQITASNFTLTHNGPTAGGMINLGETNVANNLTITSNSARNLTNTIGAVIVRDIADINTGGGNITLTGANTDFNILRAGGANITISDTNAMQIGTTVATGTYSLTTKGPMASYNSETMTVGGMATFTANNGGFGYADPYINLPNNNDFQGTVVLSASSTGPTGTGGWATIKDINALTLGAVTLGSHFTVTSGASSAGNLIGSGTIVVPQQTTITAGAGNNVTLDDASNNFGYIRVVSGNDITLVDTNGIVFGAFNGVSAFSSTISGNLSLTAGGDISQYYWDNYQNYSQISVAGTTTFVANHASASINLYLGPSDPFFTAAPGLGQSNSFIGAVTLARNHGNTGFSNIHLRNTSSTASVLEGLTSVGSLNNVFLKYNSAPAVTLPGMTVGGQLKVYAPSVVNTASVPTNLISQSGAIVVTGDTLVQAGSTGDIDLSDAGNNFSRITVVGARDANLRDSNAVILYGNLGSNWYPFSVSRNLTITAAGTITDENAHSSAAPILVTGGLATFNAVSNDALIKYDITLDNHYNRWSSISVPAANNVTIAQYSGNLSLGNSTVNGTFDIYNNNTGYALTQVAASTITTGSTTTFNNWDNITLGSASEANNVFGNLAINRGNVTLRENDAITQASAWWIPGYTVSLTTSNGQAINLSQAGNGFGNLNLTQAGADTTTAGSGDVNVVAGYHLSQSAPWSVHGRTALTISGGYSIFLQNANNVFGPMRVIDSGNTHIYGKDWTDSGVNFHEAITDNGGTGAWSTTGGTELRAYNSAGATATGTISLTNTGNVHGDLTLYGGPVTITENDWITDWGAWATTTGNTSLAVVGAGRQIYLDHTSNQIGALAISGSPTAVFITENHNIDQASAWSIGAASVTLDSRTSAINLTQAGNVFGNITISTTPSSNLVPSSVSITEDDAITQAQAWTFKPNSGTTSPVNLVTTSGQAISLGAYDNVFGNLIVTQNGAGTGAVSIREADTAGITQAGAWTTRGVTTLDTNSVINLPNASNALGAITVNGAYIPTAVTITENDNITQASAWSLGTAPVSLNAGTNQILMTQANNVLGNISLSGAASVVSIRENDPITQTSLWNIGTTALTLATSDEQAIALNQNNVLGGLTITQYNTAASSFGAVLVTEADTNGITQSGAWTTHGVTTLNAGTNNPIVLTQAGNVLANIAISGAPSAVSVTENDAITQDSVWSLGTAPVTLVTTGDQQIDFSQFNNVLGNLTVTQGGNGVGASSVSIKENDAITQGATAWAVHGATKLDSTTNSITLANANNIFGPLQVLGGTGGSKSVTLYAKDWTDGGSAAHKAFTDVGSAGPWTTGPTTLFAYDSTGATQGGGEINLTQSNLLGALDLKGTTVTITESDAITDGAVGWTTTGTTTFNTASNVVALDNTANVLGNIALSGTPTAVSITENDDITQASVWSMGAVPITLNAQTHNIFLTQAANQLGDLTLTGANATVVENHAAGITQSGAWTVSGTTTLTAGVTNPIVLTTAGNNFGTVVVNNASNADITDTSALIFGASSVTGTLTATAGGAITQSGALTANSLLLKGAGFATLTNASNNVASLAAGFTGGDLVYTDTNDFAVAVIGGTSGITIGANDVTITSVNGTITGLSNINASSSSLAVSTGTALTLPQLTIAGAQTYTGSTVSGTGIALTGNITSSAAGAIRFNSAVALSNDWVITSTNSNINFVSTLTGANNQLTVNAGNGQIDFAAAVSGMGATTDAAVALTVSAGGTGTTFHSTLAANNGLSITGPVVFMDNVTLANGLVGSTFGGQVTLGKVGGMNLSGYDNFSFNGGVLLQSGAATINSNNSTMTFAGVNTIHGPFGLTLDSGTQTITGLDQVGADITSLVVTANTPTIPGDGISIAGPQTYNATGGTSITLNGPVTSTASGVILFNSPVVLGADSTVTSVDSNVTFAYTLDGAHDLTLSSGSGLKTFTGKVGNLSAVGDGVGASITLVGSGATTFGDTVATRSGLVAAGAVTFGGDVTLANGNTGSTFTGLVTTGAITLGGYDGLAFNGGLTLTGDTAILSNGSTLSFGNTVSGAYILTLNALSGGTGTVTGLDQIATNLTSLTVTGQTLSLPSTSLAISGPMSFTAVGGITLNGNVGSSSLPSNGQIDFNGPVTLATGLITVATANAPINFSSTVNGARALTVDAGNSTTTFSGIVGGTTPVTSLTASGTVALNGTAIATSGAQTYNNAVTLGANTTLTGSALTFSGTLNGGYTLLANVSGATTFGGIVGGLTPLASITTDSPGSVVFNTTAITTTGAQTYNELATLGANLTLTGTNLHFVSAIDGARSLTLIASGAAQLDAAVGGSTPLTAFTASGATVAVNAVTTTGAQSYTGASTFNGDLSTTNSNITINGPATLGANVVISTDTGAGNITFSGATSTINGAHALVLSAGTGNVVLGGVVGGITPLTTVDVTGYDLTVPVINSSSTQTYAALNNLTLSQSRTSSVPLSFTADSDGSGSGTFILPTSVTLVTSNQPLNINAADLDLQGTSTINTGSGLITITPTNARNLFLGGTDAAGQMTITANELGRISTSGGIDFKTTGAGWINVAGIGAGDSQNISGVLRLFAQGSGDISFITSASTFNALTSQSGSGTINLGQNLTTTNDPMIFVSPVATTATVALASGGGNIDFQSTLAANNPVTLTTGGGTLMFGGNVTGASTLTISLAGGDVSGLDRLQSTLTGLTLSNNAIVTLPAISISGPHVYNGPVSITGDLTGVGLAFNNTAVVAANNLTLDSGAGTLAFANTLGAGTNNFTLTGDEINFANTVTGTGNVTLQPSTSTLNVVVGGSATTAGLDITASDLAWLPSNLGSLTIGRTVGTGTLSVAAASNFGAVPLTLNGGGGISQTGALTAGTLTLRSNAGIDLSDTTNAFGAISILGTPTSVNIADSTALTQGAAWVLGAAPVTLNAAGNAITLTQSGNTFGTLALTGGAVQVVEAADTDLGASTVGSLAVVSTGAISTSGTVAVTGAADFKTLADAGRAITIANASTFASINAVSRNTADSANASGLISLAPGASTVLKTLATTGDMTLTAAGGTTLSQDGTSTLNAAGLELLGAGDFALTLGANAITTLVGNTGNVAFRDDSGFAIGTVNTVGLTSAGNVTLSSTGSVTQSQKIAATGLELLGVGAAYILNNVANAVATLAGDTGSVSFLDNSGFAIGTVNTVGLTTSGNTTLSSTGAVTQSQKIAAAGLELLGAGGMYALTNIANAIDTLAGNTGTISFLENSGFAIGTVNTIGLTTSGNLTLSTTGAVTQSQDVATAGLELLGSGGSYALTRNTNIIPVLAGNTGLADVHTSGALVIGSVNTAGFSTATDLSLTANGAVTQTQALSIGRNLAVATTHNAGDVTVNNNGAASTRLGSSIVGGNYTVTANNGPVSQVASTTLLVVGDLTVDSPTSILDGSGNLIGGDITLPASTSSTVRASGVITLGDRTEAGDLTVVSEAANRTFDNVALHGTAIDLNNAGNSVGGAIAVTTVASTVSTGADVQTGIVQSGGTSLNVTGVASFTAEASSAGSLGVILANDGNSFGQLRANGNIVNIKNSAARTTTIGSVVATTSFDLTTADLITQSGAIVTPALNITSPAAVTLNDSGNNVATLTIDASGNIAYTDADSFAIANLDAHNNAVSLMTGATGAITQTGALQNVGALTLSAGGAITLTGANTIASIAGASSDGHLQITDSADGLAIAGPVIAVSGDVTIRTTGDLTLNSGSTVEATAGDIALSAEGTGNFINDAGASTLTVGSGKRWLVYSKTPDLVGTVHTVKGGLTSAFRLYGKTFASDAPASIASTGNGFIYADSPSVTLTISPTITGTASQIYGDNPTATLGYAVSSGFVDSEDTSLNIGLTGSALFDTTLANSMDAGSYTIHYTGGLSASYTLVADASGVGYSVTQAPLTYTANPTSRVYGDANPVFGGTLAGFKLGQDATVLGGSITWATTADIASHVGNYASTGSGYTSSNYSFAQAAGNATAFTVTPATLTVAADGRTKIYGDADPALTFASSGYKLTDAAGTVLSGGLIRTSGETVAGGPHAIAQGTLVANSDYTISYTGNNLAITPAPLTVTADSRTKIYGDVDPSLTYLSAGYKFADADGTVLSGGLTRTAGENVADGPFAIAQGTLAANSNYTLSFTGDTLTITPAALTVAANSQTKVYGNADPALTYASSGYKFTDTAGSVLSGGLIRAAGENVVDGPFAITQDTLAASSNYTLNFTGDALTITPRPLTLTTVNQSRTYGDANPSSGSFTTGGSGLGYTDALDPVISVNSPATLASHVGSYTLVPGAVGFTSGLASNYAIAYVDGGLAVTARPISVTADNQSRTYGNANPAGGTYVLGGSGLVDGDALVSTVNVTSPATLTSNVGSYALAPNSASFASGLASDYAIAYVDGALAVTARPLTLTADNQSRLYGDANPTSGSFTIDGSGLANTDALDAAISVSSPATPASHVGSDTLTPDNAVFASGLASNYAITYADGILAITARPITLTADNQSRVYGDANPATGTFAVGGSGLANSDALFSTLDVATPALVTSNVGSYTLTPGGALFTTGLASDYTITYTDGALAVTARPITVTGSDQSRVYGDANPTSGGFVLSTGSLANADALASTILVSSPAIATSNVGSHDLAPGAVSFTNGSASNYAVTYADGSLAITPAVLTYNATTASRVYGDANPVFTGNVTGFKNGENIASATTGTFAFTSLADVTTNVSSQAIDGSGLAANNGNYTFVQEAANATALTITPRPLTVSTSSVSRYYGDANPTGIAVTTSGLVNSDAVSGADVSSAATLTSNVGSYSYVPSNAAFSSGLASNYTIGYTGGTLTIAPRPIAVTATNQSRVYGDANPTTGTHAITSGNLANTDTLASMLSVISPATATSNVGGYALTPGGLSFTNGSSANYAVTYADGSLLVTPAVLAYSATATSRYYGDANPAFAGSVTGFKNGETLATATTGPLLFASSAAVTTNVGQQAVDGSGLAANNGNYTFAQAVGNATALTITPRPLAVTATSVNRHYGDANPSVTPFVTSGLVNGDTVDGATVASAAAQTSGVGSYVATPSSATFSTGLASNYAISYVNGVLVITPRPLTLTAANQGRVYGEANPATGTVTANNLVNGDTLGVSHVTSSATLLSNVGDYGLAPSSAAFTEGSASNYAITYANGLLAITPRPLAITANAQTKIYGAADPALTYQTEAQTTARGLIAGQTLAGSLTRTAGESVAGGPYAIAQGTLSSNSNYAITYVGNNLTITPASLAYVAAPTNLFANSVPGDLSGSVTGFVGVDTLASATAGTLLWTAAASQASGPGTYAITGSGLQAVDGNYVFFQDPANASALTIVSSSSGSPPPVIPSFDSFGTPGASTLVGSFGPESVSTSLLPLNRAVDWVSLPEDAGVLVALTLPLTPADTTGSGLANFASDGNTSTLSFNTAPGAGMPRTPVASMGLSLYLQSAGGHFPVGSFQMNDTGDAISLTPVQDTPVTLPDSAGPSRQGKCELQLSADESVEIEVSLSDDGLLTVSVPSAFIEAKGVRNAALAGVVAAKRELRVAISEIKVVNLAPR